jgi:glycosyltransferase involved in cell wall biosynthesis
MSAPPAAGVAVLLRYFTVGGLERVVIDLANQLVARGVPVRVLVLFPRLRNALVTELDPRVEVVALPGGRVRRAAALRRLCCDRIVHVNFGDGTIHPAVRAALLDHPRVLVTYHSDYGHLRTAAQTLTDRVLIRTAARVVPVSAAVERYCRDELHADPSRIRVIENGIEVPADGPDRSSPAPGPSAPLRVICVGSARRHKDQATILRALAMLRSEGIPVRFAYVGDGPEMLKLVVLARELGLEDDVAWYGGLWRRDMIRELLSAADLFVTASSREGLSIAMLEAMAATLPVVAADIPAHRRVLGEDGLYFPVGSVPALTAVLRRARADPDRTAVLAAAVRRRLELFGLDRTVDAYMEVYRELGLGARGVTG